MAPVTGASRNICRAIALELADAGAAVPDVHLRNPPLVERRGQPRDVAAIVRHLSGPAHRYITIRRLT